MPINKEKLYNELLCITKKLFPIFKFEDYFIDEKKYRVFTYHNAQEKHYLNEFAFEARGIMFEIDNNDKFVRLSSYTMPKFFNYKENNFTYNIGHKKVILCLNKEDGSLVSSFMHNNKLMLKSKSSPLSDSSIIFNDFLKDDHKLKELILKYEKQNCTVILEYTSPDNQIILLYKKAKLTVLNVRNKDTGEYIPYSELKLVFGDYLVKSHEEYHDLNVEELSKIAKNQIDIEGYVVLLEDGTWIKIKTDWYSLRHNVYDSINPFTKKGRKKLLIAALNSELDDIKPLVYDNKFYLNVIDSIDAFLSDYIFRNTNIVNQWASENYNLKGNELHKKALSYFKNNKLLLKLVIGKCRGFDVSIEKEILILSFKSQFEDYNKFLDELKKIE